jgi:hypothetical protein
MGLEVEQVELHLRVPAWPLGTHLYTSKGGRVISPDTLTNGVPKVPKGCSEGFCHFWHLDILDR